MAEAEAETHQGTSSNSVANETQASQSASFRLAVAGIKKKFSRVENVSTAMLSQWMSNGGVAEEQNEEDARKIVVFDVRPLEEYNISHIPSSIRIDPDSQDMEHVKRAIQESANAGRGDGNSSKSPEPVTAVMYCSLGYRSSAMVDRVYKALCDPDQSSADTSSAFHNKVYNLEGSLFQWANENRPLVDGNDQPTQYVHPYNRVWGLLIDRNRWKWSESN